MAVVAIAVVVLAAAVLLVVELLQAGSIGLIGAAAVLAALSVGLPRLARLAARRAERDELWEPRTVGAIDEATIVDAASPLLDLGPDDWFEAEPGSEPGSEPASAPHRGSEPELEAERVPDAAIRPEAGLVDDSEGGLVHEAEPEPTVGPDVVVAPATIPPRTVELRPAELVFEPVSEPAATTVDAARLELATAEPVEQLPRPAGVPHLEPVADLATAPVLGSAIEPPDFSAEPIFDDGPIVAAATDRPSTDGPEARGARPANLRAAPDLRERPASHAS